MRFCDFNMWFQKNCFHSFNGSIVNAETNIKDATSITITFYHLIIKNFGMLFVVIHRLLLQRPLRLDKNVFRPAGFGDFV